MVNKTSPGGRGGGQNKFKKRYQYFFKKGVFKGGHNVAKGGDTKNLFARLRAQIVHPPK